MTPTAYLENARLRLEAARLLYREAYFGEALSRTYYAVFAAAQALLLSLAERPKTHKGVLVRLDLHFYGRVDTALPRELLDVRERYDYLVVHPSEEQVQRYLQEAERFIDDATHLL